MATFEDDEFDSVDAGSSSERRQCSALRINGYVVIKNRPCQITTMSTSKTGKHGAAKVHLTAIDIFNGRKYEEQSSSTSSMPVPTVTRKEYQLLDVRDGFLSLMGDDLQVKDSIVLPEGEVGKDIIEKWETKADDDVVMVTIVSALGEEQAVRVRITV